MDNSIYEKTVYPYVKMGVPVTAEFNIVMLDTNVWTDAARVARKTPNYQPLIFNKIFTPNVPLVIPEVILRECAGSGKQANMDHAVFNQLYDQAFSNISAITNIHIVTFSDLENMMIESNGGKKEYALRLGIQIAKELFTTNSSIIAALDKVKQFTEIEDALTIFDEDAGERVLLFYTMIFLSEYWSVDMLTNETAVYTDRVVLARKEKLRQLLGSITIENFHGSFSIASYDSILLDVMSDYDSQWSKSDQSNFIKHCRSNRNRKIRVHSQVANFTDIVSCNNNADFVDNFYNWTADFTKITF